MSSPVPARTLVGVNLLWLVPGVVGGTEEYATRTLAAFADRAPADLDVVVFARRALLDAHPELTSRLPTVALPIPGNHRVARVAAENTWLVREARRRAVDLLHHVGGRQPTLRAGIPTIVTVHDLQPLLHPENFGRVKRAYLARALPRSVRSAEVVVAVSDHVARQVCDRFGIEPERVVTVSSGFDPQSLGDPSEVELPPQVARLRRGRVPYFIYPAVTHPHKDHLTLIDAMAGLRAEGREVALVLTGGVGAADDQVRQRIVERGLSGVVLHVGRVPRPVLDRLIAEAEALAFPSRFEGFGIPVLEAMAIGCPVVAAEATAVPDVVGDAGVRVPPGDVAAWHRALADRLDGVPPRELLVAAGRRRAAEFTWERSAEQLEAAYRLALSRAGSAKRR